MLNQETWQTHGGADTGMQPSTPRMQETPEGSYDEIKPLSGNGRRMRPFLPKRLIDVSRAIPKLIETWSLNLSFDNEDEVPKYATLSYCWGDGADAEFQMKLTKKHWIISWLAFLLIISHRFRKMLLQ
jgi:hypothetical protein